MKNIKKITALLISVVLCLSMAVSLTACGKKDKGNGDGENSGTENGKIKYTVTVVDENSAPISGVGLIISDMTLIESRSTDASGKASVELDAENKNLGVMITSTPTGFLKPETTAGSSFCALFGDNKDITITLSKPASEETVTYTVKVVDQNGNAVEGVELQICHSVCVACPKTDASGESKKELPKSVSSGTLKVGILSAPIGYIIPEATIDGTYHATIAPGETSVTVVLTITAPTANITPFVEIG